MKTVRRPPYPKWNPGYSPCSSLTPLPLSSRRPSVSFGGFGVKQTWDYPRPVYIWDTIRAEATVESVREDRPLAEMSFVVRNQDDEEVLTGTATVYQARPTREP